MMMLLLEEDISSGECHKISVLQCVKSTQRGRHCHREGAEKRPKLALFLDCNKCIEIIIRSEKAEENIHLKHAKDKRKSIHFLCSQINLYFWGSKSRHRNKLKFRLPNITSPIYNLNQATTICYDMTTIKKKITERVSWRGTRKVSHNYSYSLQIFHSTADSSSCEM